MGWFGLVAAVVVASAFIRWGVSGHRSALGEPPARWRGRHPSRVVLSGLVFLLVAVGTASPAAASAAPATGFTGSDRGAPSVPTITWAACDGEGDPAVQCATAQVPLDYDKPKGETVPIALARVPAADQQHRIGTVFVNPGGPGGSGVGFVRDGFGSYLGELLNGKFDVVGFDPRGVGGSEPIQCFDSNDSAIEFLSSQPGFPYRPGQYRPFFDEWRHYASGCLARDQRIVAHMSTADVVRDLDLLRRAVGDRRLSYLGFSYGSYIGNTYANLFGKNIRAMVIDGVLDPRLWSSGRQISSDRIATQQVLDQFLRLCDQAGPDCAFHTAEGAVSRWNRLAKQLRAEPVDFGDGFIYSYDFLIGDMASVLYSPEVWGGPEGAAAFFDLVADAALGEAPLAATEIMQTRGAILERLGGLPATDRDQDPYAFNGLDAFYGNHCADAEYPSTYLQWRAVDVYAAAGSRFGPYWWWANTPCSAWPMNDDRYGGKWQTSTAAPVLVVGNRFDPATDYAGARASANLLRGSRLLSYAGWGHTAFGRSECVTGYVVDYLLDGSLPKRGTECPANPNPFQPSTARAAAPAPLVGLPSAWQLTGILR